jgi:hypothetical protein
MGSIVSATVPWGRPAVPGIPVPPFADSQDHSLYLRILTLYVALVDEGAPSLSTKVLCEALERSWPQPPADPGELTRLELQVSLATFFPAPWTPASLARALTGLGRRDAPTGDDRKGWKWGYDPDFTARRLDSGGWEIERHERGGRTARTLESEGDLVLLWMDHFSNRHPFPFGYRFDEDAAGTLAAAAAAARGAHAVDTAYPYLKQWREQREEIVRGTAEREA